MDLITYAYRSRTRSEIGPSNVTICKWDGEVKVVTVKWADEHVWMGLLAGRSYCRLWRGLFEQDTNLPPNCSWYMRLIFLQMHECVKDRSTVYMKTSPTQVLVATSRYLLWCRDLPVFFVDISVSGMRLQMICLWRSLIGKSSIPCAILYQWIITSARTDYNSLTLHLL